MSKVRTIVQSVFLMLVILGPHAIGSAHAFTWDEPKWAHNFYGGIMTEDRVEELADGYDYGDNDLVGYALGYDRPLIGTNWSFGFELQVSYHFGKQEYFEFGLPITVRYRPENPTWDWIEGFAFGLGMSHTTEVPIVEIETRGGSRRNLIYWLLEAEFDTGVPDRSWFVRIHHRSDAWGLLEPEGGSNALVIGLRQEF